MYFSDDELLVALAQNLVGNESYIGQLRRPDYTSTVRHVDVVLKVHQLDFGQTRCQCLTLMLESSNLVGDVMTLIRRLITMMGIATPSGPSMWDLKVILTSCLRHIEAFSDHELTSDLKIMLTSD